MLEVTNLSKRYGQKQAIDGISFSIRQGEAVGFLGVNGAGKSTTMNILTGYLSASDGEVVIDGVDILTEPLKAKAKIGYLPEQPPLYLDMKVIEYLRFLYELKKVKKNPNIKQTQQEYLEQIMELVKIKEVSERVIRNLSKGYRQRVGLAQALVGELTELHDHALPDPALWQEDYRARCVNIGQQVQVVRGDAVRHAVAEGIDPQYGLTVRYEDGAVETLYSGEVSVRGLYGYSE